MANSEYKGKILAGLAPIEPVLGGVAPFTPVRWSPVGAIFRAQDTIPATSRRVLADWSLSGATDWAQPAGSTDPGSNASPVVERYPGSTWRSLGTFFAHVTPGCELVAFAVASPSGLVQKLQASPAGYISDGSWAEVRVGVTWSNGASSTGPHRRSAPIPGSPDGDYTGLEAVAAGANWTQTRVVPIGRLSPPEYTTDPAVAAAYSEWSDAEIEIEIRGGARVQQVVVFERPLSHVTEHDNDGLTSVHAMPASLSPLTPGPMTRAPDGATYEEHRHGMLRAMQVAERQSERLGPRIMHWTCWDESDTAIWDQAEGNPVTTTSTSFVHLLDSAITSYATTTPGWVAAGGYAKLARLCAPVLIGCDEIAAVPVRVRVDASRSVANGIVRVQCGAYDWVDVTVTGGRGTYEATGYLQSQVHPDHDAPPLVVWVRSLAGGTLSVYGVSVDFGTW